MNIHAISAQAVEAVAIEKGIDRPVRLAVTLTNPAGVFQVDELLKRKLTNSTLAPYVEVVASLPDGAERRLVEIFKQ
jgi:hypothetical protein